MGTNERKYKAKATDWGLGKASTGTYQIAVNFQVLTPNAPESVLTWYGYFSDAAWERTVESLQHMGWEGDDPAELQSRGGGLDKNEVELVVQDEEYPAGSGQFHAKVRWVNRIGVAISAPLSETEAKSFAAQLRDKIRAKKLAGGQKASRPSTNGSHVQPPSGPPEPPPLTDKDINF